jgi:GLPGLI family protein
MYIKMKKIICLALTLLTLNMAFSQNGEGKITYEQKINVHKRLPPEAEQMKAMIPEFQTNVLELYFTPTSSLFKMAKTQGDQLPTADGGGGPRMRMGFGGMGGGDAETFRDYENEMVVESRELGPKRYLIEDTLRPLKWKLEDETMQVAGYTCRKATTSIQGFGMANMMRGGGGQGQGGGQAQGAGQTGRRDSTITRMMNEKQSVVAWYTEDIPTSAGPDNYFGLPGLILYLDIDNGTIVFSPTKLEPVSKDIAVKAPTKGNKITREEYRKLMQQQFQSMRGGPGGGGQQVIIRQ